MGSVWSLKRSFHGENCLNAFYSFIILVSNCFKMFCFLFKGEDDVALCGIKAGKPTLGHYRNPGLKSAPTLLDETTPQLGFSNVNVFIKDGVITCSFTRASAMPRVSNYFDTTSKKFFILFASGIFKDGGKLRNLDKFRHLDILTLFNITKVKLIIILTAELIRRK